MLFNRKRKISAGFTKEDIPLNESDNIMYFFENIINKFISEVEDDDNEESLTQKLVQLSNAEDSMWVFVQENKNKKIRSKEDIGISPKSKPTKVFFVLEAKRLNSNKSYNKRRKEYVVGRYDKEKYIDSGGIERFKKDKHGANLKLSGMIGYLETENFESWKDKINGWIDDEISTPTSKELSWDFDDKLVEQNKMIQTARFISTHNRLSETKINLTHLWIKLNT